LSVSAPCIATKANIEADLTFWELLRAKGAELKDQDFDHGTHYRNWSKWSSDLRIQDKIFESTEFARQLARLASHADSNLNFEFA
jgi:hypothetical protein